MVVLLRCPDKGVHGAGCFQFEILCRFELRCSEPAGAPPAPLDFDYSQMMDNQPFGKALLQESALKAGTDCKEERKCSALVMEVAKCNRSRQRAE